MNTIDQLKLFLEPGSVAVVGASAYSGERAFNVVEYLDHYGYRGRVYPVNPKYAEILGRKSYASLIDIPDTVDLALISTPREIVPQIVRQCAEKGIRAAIVVAQAFADAADDEGKRLQQELDKAAREGGVRILGPNTLGTANAFINFSTSFNKVLGMEKLPVGLVCQSGVFFGTFGRVSLIGKAIDLGNASDIGFTEALEYFWQDPQVKVIVLQIEGTRDSRGLLEMARRVTREKPVLALKTGRSERGAVAALSHTGSLVGKDEVWEAAFKQCGIIRVNDIDELSDLVRGFSYLPQIKGRGIGIISFSGAFGIISVDACAKYDLEVAELSAETVQRLKDISPPWLGVGNPLDLWPGAMISPAPFGETLRVGLKTVLSDNAVDAVMMMVGAFVDRFSPTITEVIQEVGDAFKDKPVVLCPFEGWKFNISIDELEEKLETTGKAITFSSPERAARVLSKLVDYYRFRSTVQATQSADKEIIPRVI